MLSLTDAAAYLGYSASGLRKLVRRGELRAFQVRKHAPLKFKKEWLDAFIEMHSQAPDTTCIAAPRRKSKTPPITDGAFGFDASLLN